MGQQSSVLPASPSRSSTRGFQPIEGFQPVERNSADWKPNGAQCGDCEDRFSLTLRPHHCRVCGGVFCDRCCPKRHLFHDNRACKDCTIKGITRVKDELVKEAQIRSNIGAQRQ